MKSLFLLLTMKAQNVIAAFLYSLLLENTPPPQNMVPCSFPLKYGSLSFSLPRQKGGSFFLSFRFTPFPLSPEQMNKPFLSLLGRISRDPPFRARSFCSQAGALVNTPPPSPCLLDKNFFPPFEQQELPPFPMLR